MKRAILLFVVFALLSIACGSTGSEYVAPPASNTSQPANTAPSASNTPQPANTSPPRYPQCNQATVGVSTTCRIDHAYCSYQPNVNGNPTFCNDAPYPNHDFTFLVWGQDWSDLDGRCLIVTGTVSLYKGMPQIEAQNRSQIMEYCD